MSNVKCSPMFLPRKKSLLKRIFSHQAALVVLGFLLLGAIGYPLAKNIGKQRIINDEIGELEKEIAELEGKNLELARLIEYLGSDQFTEDQARLKLNLKKEGEEVVVIKDGETPSGEDDKTGGGSLSPAALAERGDIYGAAGAPRPAAKAVSNPRKWWLYFWE